MAFAGHLSPRRHHHVPSHLAEALLHVGTTKAMSGSSNSDELHELERIINFFMSATIPNFSGGATTVPFKSKESWKNKPQFKPQNGFDIKPTAVH